MQINRIKRANVEIVYYICDLFNIISKMNLKPFISRFLLLSLLLSVKTGLFAYDFAIEDLCYTITSVEDKTVELTLMKTTKDYVRIEIPSHVEHDNISYAVTSIGYMAFKAARVIGVKIPDTVISIGDYAFSDRHLLSLTLGNNVKYIGVGAFSNMPELESLEIPNSVISIGNKAFSDCISLSSVSLGDNIQIIGWEAFKNCKKLTSVYMPNSIIEVGRSAFEGCEAMTNLKLSESLEKISQRAFYGCKKITNITIPNSVTIIEYQAFYNCINTEQLTLGGSIKRIDSEAFRELCVLEGIIDFPSSLEFIGDKSFANCGAEGYVFKSSTPPELGLDCFGNVANHYYVLFVPNAFLQDYLDSWRYPYKTVYSDTSLEGVIRYWGYVNYAYIVTYNTYDDILNGGIKAKPDDPFGNHSYTLTITATGDGYVSYNDVSVENDTKSFSIEEAVRVVVKFHPSEGNLIKSATMNGRQIADLSSMSFTIDSMDENVTIAVEYEPIPPNPSKGDLNGDGNIDSADIEEIKNYIMGNPSSYFSVVDADINKDGVVNVADIVFITNKCMNNGNSSDDVESGTTNNDNDNGNSNNDTESGTTNSDNENGNDIDFSGKYLTFVALESGTFRFSGTINYSLDNGSTWAELLSYTDSPTVSAGSKIMWKANKSSGSVGRFSSTGRFNVEGNVMSLLYGDDFADKTSLSGRTYVFKDLFSGCTGLTSAENLSLPATTLANGCYGSMFRDCTSLTTAPVLPATTLASYCYWTMFYGCTSLTTAPELPATTLANYCYEYMFGYCTSLTTAPELPATTVADSCYYTMFYGCTSLTTAPSVLPATTLAYYCYGYMFYGCTSLTTAPQLPATTLTSQCYESMFSGCTSLNYIKCLATDISAYRCTRNWVSGGVPSTGTFVKATSMNDWTTGNDGIPSGWTVYNE